MPRALRRRADIAAALLMDAHDVLPAHATKPERHERNRWQFRGPISNASINSAGSADFACSHRHRHAAPQSQRQRSTSYTAMAGRRRSDRALRGKLRSPGRPPVARQEHRRRFWAFIAEGLSSEDAAMEVGVSQPVGTRWFREAGGMAPSHLSRSSKPLSGRYLTFAEREEIALWRARGLGVREIARRSGRAASTISRELRRNAATRGGNLDYRATTAQWHAERAARRPKRAKLATNAALRAYVQERLAGAVVAPGGAAVPGPAVPWKGRRHGPRQMPTMGVGRGARSRSPSACGSTTRMTRACASATRRSTRRFTCKAGVR